MSWENIKQQRLADALIIEHKSLTELDNVYDLIDWVHFEDKLIHIYNKTRGEQAFPPLMMFKSLLMRVS